MKSVILGLTFALAAAALVTEASAGNLYRWVDKDGRVHYTDQPPPPEAKSAERKKLGDKGVESTVPYSLQLATKNFPVTLYTAKDCGEPCKLGAALLGKRGIPFKEKNARDPGVTEEISGLTGGKLEVPLLAVGRSVLRGFEESAWNSSLNSAGYPSTAVPGVAKPSPPAKQAPPEGKEAAGKDAAKDTSAQDPTQTDTGKPPS
jgi:Domain of unknown function (DUF4124)